MMGRVIALLLLAAAGGVGAVIADEVVARTDRWPITETDLEAWHEVLSQRKSYRIVSENSEARRRWLAEQVAVSRLALEDHGRLVPGPERAWLWSEIQSREERRWWIREVLRPQIVVSEDEARLIFETHRDGYRKAPGVVVREIFLWAPTDLEELRAGKHRLADRLHASIGDAEAFSDAATEHSDATSRLVGGRIGTVLQDQIPDALARRLFTGELGLTDVIASNDGFYLFWVSAYRPPKDNSFDDVADAIISKLELQELEQLKLDASRELERRYQRDVLSLDEARRSGVACRLAGDNVELDAAMPTRLPLNDEQLARAIEGRCTQEMIRRELERLDTCPPVDPLVAFDAEVAKRILDRLAVASESAIEGGDEEAALDRQTTEVWTFEVLNVSGTGRPRLFYDLLRIEHDLGGNPELEDIRRELAERLGVASEINRYESATVHEAAGLGPEIHRAVKNRLDVGETSRPLALPDGSRIMVVRLLDRNVVSMSTPQRRRVEAEQRHQEALAVVCRGMLEDAGFEFIEKGTGPKTGP